MEGADLAGEEARLGFSPVQEFSKNNISNEKMNGALRLIRKKTKVEKTIKRVHAIEEGVNFKIPMHIENSVAQY